VGGLKAAKAQHVQADTQRKAAAKAAEAQRTAVERRQAAKPAPTTNKWRRRWAGVAAAAIAAAAAAARLWVWVIDFTSAWAIRPPACDALFQTPDGFMGARHELRRPWPEARDRERARESAGGRGGGGHVGMLAWRSAVVRSRRRRPGVSWSSHRSERKRVRQQAARAESDLRHAEAHHGPRMHGLICAGGGHADGGAGSAGGLSGLGGLTDGATGSPGWKRCRGRGMKEAAAAAAGREVGRQQAAREAAARKGSGRATRTARSSGRSRRRRRTVRGSERHLLTACAAARAQRAGGAVGQSADKGSHRALALTSLPIHNG
jgi:hypothetical protein